MVFLIGNRLIMVDLGLSLNVLSYLPGLETSPTAASPSVHISPLTPVRSERGHGGRPNRVEKDIVTGTLYNTGINSPSVRFRSSRVPLVTSPPTPRRDGKRSARSSPHSVCDA